MALHCPNLATLIMKANFHAVVAVSLLLAGTACQASRISGTYVAHASSLTEMLQLTQTPDGQISGVLSFVALKPDGAIKSEQTPVNGSADEGQLTLKFPTILSFIPGKSLAGTISGNTIHLQIVDSNGNVSSEAFERSSPAQFKAYADDMKSKGRAIVYNAKLMNLAQQYRETVANAEDWIANAGAHAERIPNAKADYEKIESQMRSLVGKERQTLDSNIRTQISLQVEQGDLAGERADMQLEQIWDLAIGRTGVKLQKEFTGWDGNCATDRQLHKQGATDQAISEWDQACKQVVAERAKFEPIYKQMSEQRANLKSFQATAQAHRRDLVNEANRIQR
jgi:hypothetical protein